MTPPRLVLFDAVGTLFTPEPSAAEVYFRAGRAAGSNLALADISHRFTAAFARQESLDAAAGDFRTSELRERARWRNIVAEVFGDLEETEPLFAILWEHFACPENWRLYEDARDAVDQIARLNLPWGIASNFDARLRRIAADCLPELNPHRLFISSEIGFRKPGIQFFRAVEQRTGLDAGELLLVGDDWQNDVNGGRQAGWRVEFVPAGSESGQPGENRFAALLAALEAC